MRAEQILAVLTLASAAAFSAPLAPAPALTDSSSAADKPPEPLTDSSSTTDKPLEAAPPLDRRIRVWVPGFILGPIAWKGLAEILFKLLQAGSRCSETLGLNLNNMQTQKKNKLKVNMLHALSFFVLFLSGIPLISMVFANWGDASIVTWLDEGWFHYYRSFAWILSVNYSWQLVFLHGLSWDLWLHHGCALLVQAVSYGEGSMACSKALMNWGIIYGWFHSSYFILNTCMVFYHTKMGSVPCAMKVGFCCHLIKNLLMNVVAYAYVFAHIHLMSTGGIIALLILPSVFIPAQVMGTRQVYQIMRKAKHGTRASDVVAAAATQESSVDGPCPEKLDAQCDGNSTRASDVEAAVTQESSVDGPWLEKLDTQCDGNSTQASDLEPAVTQESSVDGPWLQYDSMAPV